MKTDKQLYKILQAVPALFTDLTGIPLPHDYVFQAVTLKEMQRELDGVLLPQVFTADAPVYVIEFQAYHDPLIYARLLWETFGYQLQAASKNQEVEAVLFFLDASFDPKKAPWHELGRSGQAGLRVFYLDEVIAQLPAGHVLKALFLPVFEENPDTVRQQAQAAHLQLSTAPGLKPAQKENLMAVFESWLVQRFTDLSAKEIRAMFSLPATPVEETRFYREVIQEGIKKGRAEGSLAEGRQFLRRQLRKRFGELPQWVEQKLADADVETLEMWGEALLDADTLDGVFRQL